MIYNDSEKRELGVETKKAIDIKNAFKKLKHK